MMIVVESGEAKLHQSISEDRNVYEDYRNAFGKISSAISGVAIMTDTDNTAYYGDILFKRREDHREESSPGRLDASGFSRT
jgi:hypothetical protein